MCQQVACLRGSTKKPKVWERPGRCWLTWRVASAPAMRQMGSCYTQLKSANTRACIFTPERGMSE
jgi:hypothetical protein